jgi:hypothetical protein
MFQSSGGPAAPHRAAAWMSWLRRLLTRAGSDKKTNGLRLDLPRAIAIYRGDILATDIIDNTK